MLSRRSRTSTFCESVSPASTRVTCRNVPSSSVFLWSECNGY